MPSPSALTPEQRSQIIVLIALCAKIRTVQDLDLYGRKLMEYVASLLSAAQRDSERWQWFRVNSQITVNEDGAPFAYVALDETLDALTSAQRMQITDNGGFAGTDAAPLLDVLADAARQEGMNE